MRGASRCGRVGWDCRRVGRGLGRWGVVAGAYARLRFGVFESRAPLRRLMLVAGAYARLRCGCGCGCGCGCWGECAASLRLRARAGGRRLHSRPFAALRAALGGGRRGGGDANSALRASDMRHLVSPATPSTSALVKLARTAPAPRPGAHARPAAEDRQPRRACRRYRRHAGSRRSDASRDHCARNARCHGRDPGDPDPCAGFHGRALPGGHVCC